MLKRAIGLLVLLLGYGIESQAQYQTLSCGFPQYGWNAAAPTNGTSSTGFALQPSLSFISWQLGYAVAPSSVTMTLEGSNDNSLWSTLDTNTSTSGGIRNVSSAVRFIRITQTARSGGSGVTGIFNCVKATGGGGSGSGSGYSIIEEDGSVLTSRTTVNFIGAGVTCVDNVTKTDCTISAGGAVTFPLEGDTGCTNPSYSFSADTNAGLCLSAADVVIIQNAASSTRALVNLATTAGTPTAQITTVDSGGLLTGIIATDAGTNERVEIFVNNNTSPVATFSAGNILFNNLMTGLVFEGATDDAFETTVAVVDPVADHTITLPNQTGFVSPRIGGTAAPSSTECDSAAEIGRFYHQDGDPATVNAQLFHCIRTGAASFAWHSVAYMTGTTAPATCTVGAVFFDSDATAGSNWFGCTAANTWTLLGGGGTWGSITGTLADQTDLQGELLSKMPAQYPALAGAANSLWSTVNLLCYEGPTVDGFETCIQATDPTGDRLPTWPDASGDIAVIGSDGFAVRTSAGNFAARCIDAGIGGAVTNRCGAAGNPIVGPDLATTPQAVDGTGIDTDWYATKALTQSVATSVTRVSMASGSAAGGETKFTVIAADATDWQSVRGTVAFACANKAGTESCTISATDVTLTTSGTLVCSYSVSNSPTNAIDLQLNCVSSLTETSLNAYHVTTLFGTGSVTAQ